MTYNWAKKKLPDAKTGYRNLLASGLDQQVG
jgi:hypothetical protein